MRLDRFLAECGIGTRTEVKKLIRLGDVFVNGERTIKADFHINENDDKISINGQDVIYKKFVYLMLNKPQGYLSATRDGKQPTVMELVPEEYKHFNVFPVGRLDIDTEGFLLLTNDGDLAHRLLSPKKHIPKTYVAQLEKAVSEADIKDFKMGVVLDDGYKTMPARLRALPCEEQHWGEVVIDEGKFHQVKRMFESVGNRVLFLKRIKMNDLELDQGLALGEVRELTGKEMKLLLPCETTKRGIEK